MMFYVLLLVQLILIGGIFFFWFQLNSEKEPVVAGMANKGVRSFDGSKTFSTLRENETSGLGFQEEQNTVVEFENEELNKFGVMERKTEERKDFSDMDQMFGFETTPVAGTGLNKESYNEFEDLLNEKTATKKSSIEEEFADLFTEEELQENWREDLTLDTQSTKASNDSDSTFLSDFNLGNFSTSSDAVKRERKEEKQELDSLDFLRNYKFAESVDEELTDDIFEQARNKKNNLDFGNDFLFGDEKEGNGLDFGDGLSFGDEIKENDFDFGNDFSFGDEKEDGLIFEEDDLDIALMKSALPPLDSLNHQESDRGFVMEPTPRTEDEEDIFARFQSLQRMTDNIDDLK